MELPNLTAIAVGASASHAEPHSLPFISALFIIFAVLFLWNESIGFVALLTGFVLFDRNFAYSHLTLFGYPLYITEFCLALWLLRFLMHRNAFPRQGFKDWPMSVKAAWATYLIAILIAVFRGLKAHYAPAAILRDAALGYYALFVWLVSTLSFNPLRWNRAITVLSVLAFFHASIELVSQLCGSLPFAIPLLFRTQPAASSMIFCLVIIFILGRDHLRLNWHSAILLSVLMAAILIEQVRSAWTGLAGGLVLLFLMEVRVVSFGRALWRVSISLLVVSGASILLIQALSSLDSMLPKPLSIQTYAVPLSIPKPSPVVPIVSPKTPSLSQPTKVVPHLMPTPVAPPLAIRSQAAIAPRISPPSQKPLNEIEHEFDSFFQGRASENMMTRFWMWRDGVEEVFSIGLFLPDLPRAKLRYYHLPAPSQYSLEPILAIPVSGLGLRDQVVVLPVQGSPDTIIQSARSSRWSRALFGLPAGKLYLPPEVVWVVNSHNRYEPHNSAIDILYRMGLIGFVAFIGLLSAVALLCIRLLKKVPVGSLSYSWVEAATAGLGYFVIHLLTDNALENPFKGIWFWVLIGVLLSLFRSFHETSHRP